MDLGPTLGEIVCRASGGMLLIIVRPGGVLRNADVFKNHRRNDAIAESTTLRKSFPTRNNSDVVSALNFSSALPVQDNHTAQPLPL